MNSFWLENVNNKEQINNNYTVDVCIIGAGLTGLSTAYYLAKEGLKVIVLDKDGIGEKTSGHTTAKITLQHGLIYDYLINTYGLNFAMKYYESNKKAISDIKKIIQLEEIECDFEEQPNYIYTTKKEEVDKIEREVDAINAIERIYKWYKKCKFCNMLRFTI